MVQTSSSSPPLQKIRSVSPPRPLAFVVAATSPPTRARGEWKSGGAKQAGFDAYATSKQAILAAAIAFARDTPRLHFNAVEPGLNPTTGLGGADVGAFVRFLQTFVIPLLVPLLMPFIKILSTPKRAARVITKI